MKYSDKQTGKREEQLQRGLENLYGVMYREIDETITKYMKTMSKREREVQAQIDQGLFTPPNGDSDEEYMRKWRLNHVGMGKRWEAVRKGIAARITAANVRAADMINGTANAVYALNRNYQAYQIESCIPKTDIGRGASMGVAFDIVNENAVRRLESGKRKLLPEARVDIPKDQQWNMRKIQAELLSGIMQGKSVDKLAKGFKRVADMNEVQAIRHARTALGGAICAGQQANIEDAQKMGIECLKEWVATLDDRTRDSHQALDGQRVEPDEVFSNGCAYPCDPNGEPKEVYNCRCTLKTIIKGVNEERGRRIAKEGGNGEYVYLDNVTYKGRDDTRSYEKWFQGKIDAEEDPDKAREMAEEGVNEGLDVEKPRELVIDRDGNTIDINTGEVVKEADKMTAAEDIVMAAVSEYNEVRKLKKPIDSESIIDKLAGGDLTVGSCMSLALAYAANKCGLDVTDYRGGESQKSFSSGYTIRWMFGEGGIEGIGVQTETSKNQQISGEKLLRTMENDKEYILVCGKHAAVVRNGENGAEYLEMQSGRRNGFMEFRNVRTMLHDRFGAVSRKSYMSRSYLIDIETMEGNDTIRHLMGFIHNTGKQMKGSNGRER